MSDQIYTTIPCVIYSPVVQKNQLHAAPNGQTLGRIEALRQPMYESVDYPRILRLVKLH